MNTIRAIWFWGVAKCHSFMWIRESVRCNVILMVLLLARPYWQRFCAKGAVEFMQAFVAAWLEATHTEKVFTARERFIDMWAKGEWELICFSARKSKTTNYALREKTKEMDAKGINMPFNEEEFVARIQNVKDEEILEIGPPMAARWAFLHVQKMYDEAREQAPGIQQLFGDFSIDDKPSTMNLELVDWNGELVKAVLKDIDEGIQQKEVEKNEGACYMDERIALRILKGQKIDEEAVDGGSDAGEDAMEE
jgi:hypothetical protein